MPPRVEAAPGDALQPGDDDWRFHFDNQELLRKLEQSVLGTTALKVRGWVGGWCLPGMVGLAWMPVWVVG